MSQQHYPSPRSTISILHARRAAMAALPASPLVAVVLTTTHGIPILYKAQQTQQACPKAPIRCRSRMTAAALYQRLCCSWILRLLPLVRALSLIRDAMEIAQVQHRYRHRELSDHTAISGVTQIARPQHSPLVWR